MHSNGQGHVLVDLQMSYIVPCMLQMIRHRFAMSLSYTDVNYQIIAEPQAVHWCWAFLSLEHACICICIALWCRGLYGCKSIVLPLLMDTAYLTVLEGTRLQRSCTMHCMLCTVRLQSHNPRAHLLAQSSVRVRHYSKLGNSKCFHTDFA